MGGGLKNEKHESERRQQLQDAKAAEENITLVRPNAITFTTRIVVLVTFGWNQNQGPLGQQMKTAFMHKAGGRWMQKQNLMGLFVPWRLWWGI